MSEQVQCRIVIGRDRNYKVPLAKLNRLTEGDPDVDDLVDPVQGDVAPGESSSRIYWARLWYNIRLSEEAVKCSQVAAP